ncbi:MAG: ECF transporter S component [Clostridia bacterium]|nr:ECF transporter S component [Clostridia bacterium]
MKNNTKRLVLMAMFIALSFIGSYIKIPNPIFKSIALDSMPGYLAGLVLGGLEGGVVAFIGHILTAANSGFEYSLPVHLIIGVTMFITVFLYAFTYRKINLFVAGFIGIILNGIGAPLALVPLLGWGAFLAITPLLIFASAVNVILSILVYIPLKNAILND